MKLKFLCSIFLILFTQISATDQEPDILIYKGIKLTLSTGWGHPSPLETYYLQNHIKYPFEMLSTANYRGFIAHWLVENNKLYLKTIQIEDASYLPTHYIKSNEMTNSGIFAGWFSGIIQCGKRDNDNYREVEESYYFKIRKGQIVDIQLITDEDLEEINELSEIDPKDEALVNKYIMLILNQNYITYYFRLDEDDKIYLNEEKCHLIANSKHLSPILSYYDNDHLKWIYNWENLEKSGAPNCNWLVRDSKLFLQELYLYKGLEFDSIETERIALDSLFSDKVMNNMVFADWVNGVYLVKHGYEKEDAEFPSIKEFEITGYTFLNFSNGIVTEEYNLEGNFNFSKLPDNLEPKIRMIIEKYFH